MIVTTSREQYIHSNFFELSFEDREPEYDKFKTLSSAELHYLAEIYNWDDGVEVLHWIIDSDKCDAGTAMLIFWRAEPDYYTQYDESDADDWDKEIILLLKKVIKRFENQSFRHSWFGFDPVAAGYNVDGGYENQKWTISPRLKKGTVGIQPIYLGTVIGSNQGK